MNRRVFLKSSAAATLGLALTPRFLCSAEEKNVAAPALRPLLHGLLTDWCDALLRQQIDDPPHPEWHGAFRCPACGFLHGRCADAVYPLLHLAATTGEERYRTAAVRVFDWSKNVDAPDGAWTNELDPKSWKGTTVFAAIALADALRHHGRLLDTATTERWRARLKLAADFIRRQIDLQYGNINYGLNATYALALLGRVLGEPAYLERAHELAAQSSAFLSPNRLLFGEGRPADKLSAKGCRPVDLGYNVEESLPAILAYARLERDDALLETWTDAALAHLEFMLPDGAWDNSWGTRSFKWSYWGSRTAEGFQPAALLLADRHPVFATAAWRNTQLLRACTHDGLLHGGLHFASHGVPPCVHHTFAHAKALAAALDSGVDFDRLDFSAPLPRATARGVRAFAEIDTWIAAQGPWRATVTGYDWLYNPATFHATGGALSLLWHEQLGPLFAASLAKFERPEKLNTQPQPDDEDIALTPRVELRAGEKTLTNLFALDAAIRHETVPGGFRFRVRTRLTAADQADPAGGAVRFDLGYTFTDEAMTFSARPVAATSATWSLVLPLVSARAETVKRISDRRYEVTKPGGTVVLEANAPLRVLASKRDRIFNQVPGFEAVPFAIDATGDTAITSVVCRKAG